MALTQPPLALTQPPLTGTMKVSAATFAVLLATAAFCAPASASPCKSGPDHHSLGPDPHPDPDFAPLSAAAFMLSEPNDLHSYIALPRCPAVPERALSHFMAGNLSAQFFCPQDLHPGPSDAECRPMLGMLAGRGSLN